MYIRIKDRKNQKYAYLVKSKYYKRRSPKQLYSKYLGKLQEPIKINNTSFTEFIKKDPELYIENTKVEDILKDIFLKEIKNYNLYEHFIIDFSKLKIKNKKGNSIVIKLNNGYLCDYTLKNLLKFEPTTSDENRFAKELARALIEAGIDIEKDIFVLLFDKIYKKKVFDNLND